MNECLNEQFDLHLCHLRFVFGSTILEYLIWSYEKCNTFYPNIWSYMQDYTHERDKFTTGINTTLCINYVINLVKMFFTVFWMLKSWVNRYFSYFIKL